MMRRPPAAPPAATQYIQLTTFADSATVSAGGGAPRRLCDLCAPPWGTEPPAFYFGWSPGGEFAYWSFTNATYAIPLGSGRPLPDIPAGGIKSKDGIAALPGARLISEHERSVPGPNPSIYAFVRVSTQRNIYRVPVP
jgi:hypothetical protein